MAETFTITGMTSPIGIHETPARYDGPSSFGLQGAYPDNGVYCNTDYAVMAAVTDKGNVWFGIMWGAISQRWIRTRDYPCRMYVNRDWFEFSHNGNGDTVVPGGCSLVASSTVSVGDEQSWQLNVGSIGQFTWGLGEWSTYNERWSGIQTGVAITDPNSEEAFFNWRMMVKIGTVGDFHYSNNEGGYLWIAGTSVDGDTDRPVYPNAVRIDLPGFKEIVSAPIDYYPWSIRKNGSFTSLNRSGGSLAKRSGSGWTGLKNSDAPSYQNRVFSKYGGSWLKMPELP